MSSTNDAQATSADTVTVMIGSYLNLSEMLSSGVVPSLLAAGNIGLDVLDGNMANATSSSPYGNNLVTQLANAWSGSGSGGQGMAETPSFTSGMVTLSNTSSKTIYVATAGALFTAADGAVYQTVEAPTNPAWTNGTSQTGSGSYAVAPGQTVAVPVQATFLGNDATSSSAGAVLTSAIPGIAVTVPAAFSTSGSYSVSGVTVQGGGNYYMTGTSYTPTVTFSASPGATTTGHVSELYVAGEGWLGAGGTGYKIAKNVPVEDGSGNVIFSINIESVGANGAITSISLISPTALTTTIPSALSIVQSGASGGTITGTNFGVASVKIDNTGSSYSSAPSVTFSTAGSAPAASATSNAVLVTQNSWLTVSDVNIQYGGNYYVTGTAYTPTVSFSSGSGSTTTGHVSELYVAGEGNLGKAGTGYKVARNVPVQDENGHTLFTININSVSPNGAITSISLNLPNAMTATIPSTLLIVQAGGSGATMQGTNFGVATVTIDTPGSGYTTAPLVTFSNAGSAPAASGTSDTVVTSLSNSLAVSQISVTNGGNYYVNGAAYTPTITFSSGNGSTATAHVSELYVAGEGSLGAGGTGYKVANNVAVDDPSGKTIFTININSVSATGAIASISLNATGNLMSVIPSSLSIVQAGASGGTITGTNFGVSSIVLDNAGSGYLTAPTMTFSTAGAATVASGTLSTVSTTQNGWLSGGVGDYSYVFTKQGLAPAEGYVNVNTNGAWTSADVASWKGYVIAARAVGVLNVAPLDNGLSTAEDPNQAFATSAFYAGLREAASYGGGLEIEVSSSSVYTMTSTEWQSLIEKIRWCDDNGLRSTLLVDNQGNTAGSSDASFGADVDTLLQQLSVEGALPSQVVVQNNSATGSGPYYDTDTTDTNSLNAVALDIASNFALQPTSSEAGLEVKGTSTAQTTLVMTGVAPSEDVSSGGTTSFTPYASSAIYSEDPTKMLTVAVQDTAGLLSLSDSMTGTSAASGGTLTFSGTASQASTFLNDLTARSSSGAAGVATLQLKLTDYTDQTTQGVTSVYLGAVHPTFTSVSETAPVTLGDFVQAGDTVTFSVATSTAVVVDGQPSLVLTNEQLASFIGQDTNGNLLFSYTVQPGDDTQALRVRGIDLNGASITDSNSGLAITLDSLDAPEAAMENPLVVNTTTDTILNVAEAPSTSGTLYAGDEVNFLLTTAQPVIVVNGTPTLELNDGGIAAYNGLSSSGQMEFTYTIPRGGAYSGLAPTAFDANGATIVNSFGEAVIQPAAMPTPAAAVSYNATNTSSDVDTLVIGLSADEYLGDAKAVIFINSTQVSAPIDVAAVHASGQTQLVTISGNFGSNVDQLSVAFTNDLWAGTAATDRNLYIDQINLDGVNELGTTELQQTSAVTTPIAAAVQDKLALWVNEDAAGGNAMFSVSVDGSQLAGTFSTDVANSSGQWQEVDVYGSFGSGAHTVTVTDAGGAWNGQDGNGLYVEQATIDGVVETAPNQALYGPGQSTSIEFPAPQTDVLTLNVSEDAWLGDAQCYVTIDGQIFGGVTTITASHSAHSEQAITISANSLSSGSHRIGLAFINDLYGGTTATDRNLYLDSASLDGVKVGSATELQTWGTATFQIGQGASSAVSISNISSLLTGAASHVSIGVPYPVGSPSASIQSVSNLHVSPGVPESLAALLGP